MDDLPHSAMQLLCREKYFVLKRRCEEIQQANEKLVNRIYNVKKIIKRYKRERSVLMSKLDDLGDDYQEALVPAFWEEGAGAGTSHDEDNNMTTSDLSIPSVVKQETDDSEENPVESRDRIQNGTGDSQSKTQDRKPLTAFMTFCSLQRKIVQDKYLELHGEEASRSELATLFSQEWKQLSLEEKQVYIGITEAKKKKSMKSGNESTSGAATDAADNEVGGTMDLADVMEVKPEQP